MSPFRPSRRRGAGRDPHLDVKMLLFVLGAAFGAAGIITERGVLIYIGIAVLAAGLLLRLRRGRSESQTPDDAG